jgi:hypothetical protein
MVPSQEELAEYGQLLGISPDATLQPTENLLRDALADVPVVLKDLSKRDPYLPRGNPNPDEAIVSTDDLVSMLERRGHDFRVASWAIYNLIRQGHLGAEIAIRCFPSLPGGGGKIFWNSDTPNFRTKGEKSVESFGVPRIRVRLDLSALEVSTVPGAPVYPAQDRVSDLIINLDNIGATHPLGESCDKYKYLVVWPTMSLWDWQNSSPTATPSLPECGSKTESLTESPEAESKLVKLFGQGKPPIVRGKKKQPLSKKQYELVAHLIQAGETGAKKSRLERIYTDYWRSLKKLTKSDEDWDTVIHFPGKPHGGYRID